MAVPLVSRETHTAEDAQVLSLLPAKVAWIFCVSLVATVLSVKRAAAAYCVVDGVGEDVDKVDVVGEDVDELDVVGKDIVEVDADDGAGL